MKDKPDTMLDKAIKTDDSNVDFTDDLRFRDVRETFATIALSMSQDYRIAMEVLVTHMDTAGQRRNESVHNAFAVMRCLMRGMQVQSVEYMACRGAMSFYKIKG